MQVSSHGIVFVCLTPVHYHKAVLFYLFIYLLAYLFIHLPGSPTEYKFHEASFTFMGGSPQMIIEWESVPQSWGLQRIIVQCPNLEDQVAPVLAEALRSLDLRPVVLSLSQV